MDIRESYDSAAAAYAEHAEEAPRRSERVSSGAALALGGRSEMTVQKHRFPTPRTEVAGYPAGGAIEYRRSTSCEL
jgi:hypothetical protein